MHALTPPTYFQRSRPPTVHPVTTPLTPTTNRNSAVSVHSP